MQAEVIIQNETENYTMDSFITSIPEEEELRDTFLACQKEYGRCTSSVYIDRPVGTPQRIGWAFSRRVNYDDSERSFIQTTWVTLGTFTPATPATFKTISLP